MISASSDPVPDDTTIKKVSEVDDHENRIDIKVDDDEIGDSERYIADSGAWKGGCKHKIIVSFELTLSIILICSGNLVV